jgi:general secretion pathway protein A
MLGSEYGSMTGNVVMPNVKPMAHGPSGIPSPSALTGSDHLMDLLNTQPSLETLSKLMPQVPRAHHYDFLSFFKLQLNPFADSVNPAFFYKTEAHDQVYIRMLLAIEHDISLALLTGVSGTGKTLVSQMLLKDLDPSMYQTILVLVSPNMSKTALLKEILSELGVTTTEGQTAVSAQDLLKQLQDYIIKLHDTGRKLVIIVDECHFLSAESLHMVRTISNIESSERKLSTCLLLGEQRFLKRLEHPSYQSLRNRMYLRSELLPLKKEDCDQYIKFRLLVAGREKELFAPKALEAIHKLSGGVCRQINKICMLALLEGFTQRKALIDEEIINACAGQL